jgi:hypothetical protein
MMPFFRLSTPLTRAWAVNREARHKLARWLANEFAKTGVAVCTDALSVVAWVNPLAQIKFTTPPFQKIERHQCVNNPTWRMCECRRWFDPESGLAWGNGGARAIILYVSSTSAPSEGGGRSTSNQA